MFIGHYGPAVWDTQRGHNAPIIKLWQGFLAVQAMDIVTGFLVLLGVEGTRMVDGMPLFHIPWSHSLVGAIFIALVAGLIFKTLKPSTGKRGFWVVAILAFSHWPLDLLVHRPDLLLYPGATNPMGFSLWNFAWPSFLVEVLLLGGALAWWLRVSSGPRWTVFATAILFALMSAVHFGAITMVTLQVQAGTFDPSSQPQGPIAGVVMLTMFVVITALIGWIERYRPSRFTQVNQV